MLYYFNVQFFDNVLVTVALVPVTLAVVVRLNLAVFSNCTVLFWTLLMLQCLMMWLLLSNCLLWHLLKLFIAFICCLLLPLFTVVLFDFHYAKSVVIRNYSGPYFHAFWLNTGRYFLSLCIQSKCGNIQTIITPTNWNISCSTLKRMKNYISSETKPLC